MQIPEGTPLPVAIQPAAPARASLLARQWWIAFSLSSLCVVSGHLTIKMGLNAASHAAPSPSGMLQHVIHLLLQPQIVTGLLIYLIGTACWMIAVSQKEISFLYPLSSVNYVLVVVASALLLSETISARRTGGILLIVLGMFLLNRGSRRMHS